VWDFRPLVCENLPKALTWNLWSKVLFFKSFRENWIGSKLSSPLLTDYKIVDKEFGVNPPYDEASPFVQIFWNLY